MLNIYVHYPQHSYQPDTQNSVSLVGDNPLKLMLIHWSTEKIDEDSSLLGCYIVLAGEQLQMCQSIAVPSNLGSGNLFIKYLIIQDRGTTLLHNITIYQVM